MRSLLSELIDKGLVQAHRCDVVKFDRKTRDMCKERLTDRVLRELMGMNRDTYRRGTDGAIRRR